MKNSSIHRPSLRLYSCFLFAAAAAGQVNITTWQANLQHTGTNLNETILTPQNVGAPGGFGLLFTQTLDGQSYGQPLYVGASTLGKFADGSSHNVVYVATEHDSVYAFDADSNAAAPDNAPLWHVSLLPPGTTPIPAGDVGSSDIQVEIGITATPVIDPVTSTLYIVSAVETTSTGTFQQYLNALDLKTGAPKFGSPVQVNPTFAGSSYDAINGVIPFNAVHEHARAAMILYNGVVYISYASHSDTQPYHGELLGYNAASLQLISTFIATPNGPQGGIWGSGAGPAVDSQGNMFISLANGPFDQNTSPYTAGTDWGESIVKLPTNTIGPIPLAFANTANWFTPNIWSSLNGNDLDLGAGGVLLLPDQTGGTHPHLLAGGGKGGVLYVIDRDNLGGINTPDAAVQEIPQVNGGYFFTTPAYYNGYIYYSAANGPLLQRAVGFDPATGNYISPAPISSINTYPNKGSGVFISANGSNNGIVWILNGNGLDAYNAANVSGSPVVTVQSTVPSGNISTQNTKYSLPMEVNGKVYFTAYSPNNNTGYLFVSGLLGASGTPPAAPGNLQASGISSGSVALTWTDDSNDESGFNILRATSATGPFTPVGLVGANIVTYTDTGLSPSTTWFYEVEATNASGSSGPTNVATATTFPTFTPAGIVAYWNMDALGPNSSVSDVTGNGNNGTANGEVVFTQGGFINGTFMFHGTDVASNISVPNSASLQFATNESFTLSAWANPSNVDETEQPIVAKSVGQGNQYGIYINSSNNWTFRGPAGDLVGSPVTQGAWTNVAAVQDGVAGTRSLYVNGALVASGAAQAADGAGALVMGQASATGGSAGYEGLIDEVRLYDVALTPGGITDLLGPPVLEAVSNQTHGAAGTFGLILSPSAAPVVEPRQGAVAGAYSVALHFDAPVSTGITASLSLQSGGSAVGSISSVDYDPTSTIVTVNLTGVANIQALNIHLTGVNPGNGAADISLDVLWGDVNGDYVVNSLDLTSVQSNFTQTVSQNTAVFDINGDGVVNSLDASLVSAAIGASLLPQVANAAVSAVTASSATITWNTNEPSSSQVEYGTTLTYGTSSTLSATPVTSHSVTLTGLSSNTTYDFAVLSANSAGTVASANFIFMTPVAAPAISNVASSGVTATTATITWTTDQPSTSQVEYGTTGGYGTSSGLISAAVTSHSITLTGLSTGTTYDYAAMSTNSARTTTSANFSFSTAAAIPVIGNVASSGLTATTATITWSTDQPSTSQVEYGITTSYGTSSGLNFTAVTSHSTTLTGLSPNTSYNYAVVSTNSAGTATSANFTFSTPLPVLSSTISRVGGAANNTGGSTAPASMSVAYSSGTGNTIVAVCALGSTSSSITSITDGGSAWALRAFANNGTAVRSEIWSTTAGGSVASTLFTINISGGTPTACALEEYAGVLSLGATTTSEATSGTASAGLVTQNANNYVVAGLGANSYFGYFATSGTIEQLAVLTSNPGNNYVEMALCDNTAATATSVACTSVSSPAPWAAPALELRSAAAVSPPGISAVTSSSVTATSATITWTTDQPSTSQVEYGATTTYGTSSALNSSPLTSHSVTLAGLTPGTTYDYAAISSNAGGSATSANFTFATPVSLPVISAVISTSITATSATITWTTDQPSTSQVEYGTTTTYGASSTLNSSPVTSHSATLTYLTPGTTYNYAAISADPAGTTTSANFTLSTPQIVLASTISRVGGAANNTGSSTTPGSLSIVYPSSAGNTIVAVCALGSTSSSISAITDSGSAWALRAFASNGAAVRSEIWSTAAGGSAASTSFTISLSGGAPTGCALEEYAGVLSLGATATSQATSGSISVGLATQNPNNYIVAGLGANSYFGYSASNGVIRQLAALTSNSGNNYVEIALCDNTAATAISVTCSSVSGSAPWAAPALELRSVSGAVSIPVIGNVTSSGVTATSATITWTTVQPSTSQVNYGTTTSYSASSVLNSSPVAAHSVMLTGLSPNTTYDFAVVSTDSAGPATSANYTFATSMAAPLISAVTSSGVTATSASIAWTTDQPSSSQVRYGTTVGYGMSSALNSTLVTPHSVTLTGLTPGTTYNYAAISADGGGPATSANFTFSTPSTIPTIGNVTAGGVSTTSATITWTTDQPSSSQVQYGITTAYGTSSGPLASPVTSHSVTLTGLTPGTPYDYEVMSGDSAGTATSANFTFSTPFTPPAVPISPVGGASRNTGNGNAVNSLSIAYSSKNGNTVVAVCALGSTASSIASITDSGSVWALRGYVAGGSRVRSEIWSTSAGGSVASTSFTVKMSAAAPMSCALEEYAGVSSLGITAANQGNSGTISVGLTTQDAGDYVVAGLGANSYNGYLTINGTVRQSGGLASNSGGNYVEMNLCDSTAAAATSVTCSSVSGPAPFAAPALELR